jgi:hypothetical protein
MNRDTATASIRRLFISFASMTADIPFYRELLDKAYAEISFAFT